MSKITDIKYQEKNKNRCNIFIDGDFFIGMPLDIVINHSLKVGMDIDKNFLETLTKEKDLKDALDKALFYVSKTIKTKKQVKEYLIKKGYSEEIAYQCIDKLKEYKFIDDSEYARRYIENNCNSHGKNLLSYKLMMKGVKKDYIENAYEDLNINSKEYAYNLACKKIKNKEITNELLSKTYRYLISKGFSYDDAGYAIDKIKGEL